MIYLDHAATTPMDPEVLEAMKPFMAGHGTFGNPSSLHQAGRKAKQAVEDAKEKIAELLGAADDDDFLFTSSGTESDNLAIIGVAQTLKPKGKHIITTQIEHPAVLEPCKYLEFQDRRVTYLPVDSEGFVALKALEEAISPDTVLVSIMHGNNEMGTLQDLHRLGGFLKRQNILLHTDAVQTVGKIPIDLKNLPVDYLSFSGHKLYGPKGIGGLYIRKGVPKPTPLMYGGGHQGGFRPGTENVSGIVGLAKALEICSDLVESETTRLHRLQNELIESISGITDEMGVNAVLNGPRDLNKRVPGNVNFSFPPMEGESLVLKLDMRGICISSGSACHSNEAGADILPSHVIEALGKGKEVAQSSIRISMGRATTDAELKKLIEALQKVLHKQRKPQKRLSEKF